MYVCTCVRIFTYRLFKHLRVSFVIGTARWQASTNIFQLIFLARSTESCYLFTVETSALSAPDQAEAVFLTTQFHNFKFVFPGFEHKIPLS